MVRLDWGREALNYTDEGTGSVILFLHGLGGNANNWLKQRRSLSDHHRVIALDLPGHGRSTGRQVPFEGYADAAAHVLEAVKATGVSVVGLAMGARIGIALAHRTPERIARLTMVNPYLELPPEEHAKRIALYDLLLEPDGPTQWATQLLEGMGVAEIPGITRGFMGSLDDIDPEHINRVFHEVDGSDQSIELENLELPIQIMVGGRDRLVPESSTHALKKLVRHPVTHQFPTSGHLPYLEDPASFNSALDSFIHS